MSTTTTTQTRPTRGRGGNRNKSKANHRKSSEPVAREEPKNETKDKETSAADEDDIAVCWICAEQVKYYSISECNHRTCHVCALRLRALYKKTDCTFCKEPQPTVIFTLSDEQLYTQFDQVAMQKDGKLNIVFETQEMMEETMILLRYNCPDTDCDYIATGWNDLKLHVRAVHSKMLCDLCLKNKKVFSHEHTLYTFPQLVTHLPSIPHRANMKPIPRDQIEGIHPLCEFCHECFFSGDELYKHMRERHEECFVCKRNDVRDQYFVDYNSLEKHFHTAHYPCPQPACLAQKFVVFGSTIDLQAHMVEEHGADMTARDKKEARKVRAPFEFEDVGVRRGHHQQQQQQQQQQQRPPPPPSQPPTVASAGPSRPRRREFGSSLTVEDAGGGTPPQTRTPTPPGPSNDNGGGSDNHSATTLSRHNHFLSRLSAHLPNPASGIPAIKSAIRSYRCAESTSRDLILTIFESTGRNLEGTASVVNGFVDLLDPDEEEENGRRRVEVLGSWKGFEVEQRRERQFPELSTLSALSLGSGGGWGAGTGGRVLNAKKTTRNRSSSRVIWDRVARAAGSSVNPSGPSSSSTPPTRAGPDKFPSLPLKPTKSLPQSTTPYKQTQRSTPWAPPPPSQPSVSSVPYSVPGTGSTSGKPPPPPLSSTLFPSLPSSTKGKDKPIISGTSSWKNIAGKGKDVGNVWGPSPTPGEEVDPLSSSTNGAEVNGGGGQGGKGKKKGKQKQTLFSTFTPVG